MWRGADLIKSIHTSSTPQVSAYMYLCIIDYHYWYKFIKHIVNVCYIELQKFVKMYFCFFLYKQRNVKKKNVATGID